MRRARLLLALAGSGLFALALAALIAGSGVLGPLGGVATLFDTDYLLVAALGICAFVIVICVLLVRALAGINQTVPPAPETARSAPQPGAGFDDAVSGGIDLRTLLFGDRRELIRSRLRDAAVATVERKTATTGRAAETRVAEGTWTDDTVAAEFLADGHSPNGSDSLTAVIRGAAPYQHAARRAAREIARFDTEDDR